MLGTIICACINSLFPTSSSLHSFHSLAHPPFPVSLPVITDHPKSQVIAPGQSTSFSVSARGYKLMYQWQMNGVDITNANSATYTIPSVAEPNEGHYQCVVSNAAGMVTSNAARLTICKQAT